MQAHARVCEENKFIKIRVRKNDLLVKGASLKDHVRRVGGPRGGDILCIHGQDDILKDDLCTYQLLAPLSPPGAVCGEGWGFDQTSD